MPGHKQLCKSCDLHRNFISVVHFKGFFLKIVLQIMYEHLNALPFRFLKTDSANANGPTGTLASFFRQCQTSLKLEKKKLHLNLDVKCMTTSAVI